MSDKLTGELKNRKGVIRISKFLFDNHLDVVGQVLEKMQFIPVGVECLYMSDCIEMYGYSWFFKAIEPQYTTPDYTISVKVDIDEKGKHIVKSVQVDEYDSSNNVGGYSQFLSDFKVDNNKEE